MTGSNLALWSSSPAAPSLPLPKASNISFRAAPVASLTSLTLSLTEATLPGEKASLAAADRDPLEALHLSVLMQQELIAISDLDHLLNP